MNKNVPNILTISRIICTPIMILMFLLPINNGIGVFVALGIYVLGCFTDFLDGYIARKYNLISDFGKFMDQIADKFITTSAMILVLFAGAVKPMWVAILILLIVVLRDILISGIRMYAANKNIVIAADIFGKIKSLLLDIATMILMANIGLSLVSNQTETLSTVNNVIGYVGLGLICLGTVMALLSCVNYSVKAVVSMKKASEVK